MQTMGFIGSDDFYMMFAPVVVYWAYSGMYEVLSSRVEKYRLHSRKEEETKNLASKKDVVKGVLLQQAIQAAIAFTVLQVCDRGLSYSISSFFFIFVVSISF